MERVEALVREASGTMLPIVGAVAHVHDGEDLQFVVANLEDERKRKNLKTTPAQLPFEATMHLQAGSDPHGEGVEPPPPNVGRIEL